MHDAEDGCAGEGARDGDREVLEGRQLGRAELGVVGPGVENDAEVLARVWTGRLAAAALQRDGDADFGRPRQ